MACGAALSGTLSSQFWVPRAGECQCARALGEREGGRNAGCSCRLCRGSGLARGIVPGLSTMAAFVCACVLAGGGGGARARAQTRTREPRLISDPWVVRGEVRGEVVCGAPFSEWEPFWARELRTSLCVRSGFLSEKSGRLGVCARERGVGSGEEGGLGMWEGAVRGVAFTRGNGGDLLCVVLGGAVAH